MYGSEDAEPRDYAWKMQTCRLKEINIKERNDSIAGGYAVYKGVIYE